MLAVLPSADTLFIPSGSYKMDMNEPRVLLSMEDYESDVEHLGVSPNHMPATDSPDDTAIDISAMVLSDPRSAFLSRVSFAEGIMQDMALGGLSTLIVCVAMQWRKWEPVSQCIQ